MDLSSIVGQMAGQNRLWIYVMCYINRVYSCVCKDAHILPRLDSRDSRGGGGGGGGHLGI